MLQLRLILFVVSILLTTFGAAMLVPALFDLAVGHADWQVFLAAAGTSLFLSITLMLATRQRAQRFKLQVKEAFVLTTTAWILMPAFAALPFVFSELSLSYTDAFFEAMSGLTTTGSTVITGLDHAPPGILVWRALLQWLGGIGVVVMAIAVLPLLQVGGMQLFRMESSDRSEKAMPRITQFAAVLGLIYLALTFACTIAYWGAGMTALDAMAHAMTTIATGGFSTHDLSMGHFDDGLIDYIAVVFMLLGSLPFVLYLQTVRGQPWRLWRDSQVRWFFTIVVLCVASMVAWQYFWLDRDAALALRHGTFNVISIITGTGYSTTDYGLWGSFAVVGFFFFMFIGGCAGSTSCGIKIFRFQILAEVARTQMSRLLRPHAVAVPRYDGRPLNASAIDSVMSFFFLFVLVFGVLTLVLTSLGLDFVTSLSGAGTAIANVGPALGPTIGPAGTFQSLPDAAKWALSIGMLLGRLELFTVLVLFTPAFWRG